MSHEPFMLVSLDEEKAKRLAQVISNETCTKVLNHLAQGRDGSETEIAKTLGLPLSTVHYNLKLLVEAKLVLADEYHYSEKGREVLHYRLANRYIIIAPLEEKESFLKKLRGILPALFITICAAAIFKLVNQYLAGRGAAAPVSLAMEAAPAAAPVGAKLLAATPPAPPSAAVALFPNEAMLFFIGGALFLTLIFAVSAYVNRKG
jgi:DNA-binding transcriptional ArsR family regulator